MTPCLVEHWVYGDSCLRESSHRGFHVGSTAIWDESGTTYPDRFDHEITLLERQLDEIDSRNSDLVGTIDELNDSIAWQNREIEKLHRRLGAYEYERSS